MNYQIVTNNPKVKDDYKDIIFVEGNFEDVLVKVRNLVHAGYVLINHPLGASIRMLYSPYRSIIIGDKQEKVNDIYVETIENSIENYRKNMEHRSPDVVNGDDYSIIDSELLESALGEHKRNLATSIN